MTSGLFYSSRRAENPTQFTRLRLGEHSLSEAWLRDALYQTPELIPIGEAFPGTPGVVTVCTELPLADRNSSLSLDVFGVTPNGRPVLIECKLWRNPEARRKVVTQILEYSALLRTLTYGSLEATLKRRLGWRSENPLFKHVREKFPDADEIGFVEGLTNSLESGEFLLLIAGDGIRTDAQTLVRLLEGTGMVAQLAMMEVQLWQCDRGEAFFVAPTIPTRCEVEKYKVFVGPDNQPLSVAESTDPHDGITESDQTGSGPRRRDPEEIQAEKAFWHDFLQTLQFDNPEQELPVYRHPNHVRAPMPYPAHRIVLYKKKDGEAGVFIVVKNDEEGERLAEWLEADLEAITEEVGLPVEALRRSKTNAPYFRAIENFDTESEKIDARQADWLRDAANRMVNAFRPRVEAFE